MHSGRCHRLSGLGFTVQRVGIRRCGRRQYHCCRSALYAIRGQFKNYLFRTRLLFYVLFAPSAGSFPALTSIVNFIFAFFGCKPYYGAVHHELPTMSCCPSRFYQAFYHQLGDAFTMNRRISKPIPLVSFPFSLKPIFAFDTLSSKTLKSHNSKHCRH